MADPTPPTPAPAPSPDTLKALEAAAGTLISIPEPVATTGLSWIHKTVLWLNFAIGLLAIGAWLLQGSNGTPPPIPLIPQQTAPATTPPPEPVRAMGWVNNPLEVQKVKNSLPIGERNFRDTPAGKAVHGNNGTVLLCDAAKTVLGKHLPDRNQGQVGCCVSFGVGTAIEYLQLSQIANGDLNEFKEVCNEAIYGGARVQVGGGQIRGDGAVTAWGGQWSKGWGINAREKNVGGFDLTTYSESRARSWGNTGCPKTLEPIAKQSPVKGITFATNADDVAKALRQGYAVAVGSMQGFGAIGPYVRDKDGFLAPSGQWGHCQAVIGVRDDNRKGFLFTNSWGSDWISGPKGKYDIPNGAYWVDWNTANGMFGEGDCVVFSDAVGFPARQLDWFTKKKPKNEFDNILVAFTLR